MEQFDTFSTTADVGIRIWGNGFPGLLKAALKGFNRLCFGEQWEEQHDPPTGSHPFVFEGDSFENLLVNFLSEILYILQVEDKVTLAVTVEEADENHINVCFSTLQRPLCLEAEMEIKSVTYHNLAVREGQGLKSAEVIFDI